MSRALAKLCSLLPRAAQQAALHPGACSGGAQLPLLLARSACLPWQQHGLPGAGSQRRLVHGAAGEQVAELEQQARALQEAAAQRAMQDPMSVLMAAAGVPLGITLRMAPDGPAHGSSAAADEPGQRAQEQHPQPSDASEQPATECGAAAPEHLLEMRSGGDSWGTTSAHASSIAQRIAESNADLHDDAQQELGDADAEQLTAAGLRYLNEQALAEDVQHMDEIYQLLAQVPWLDENNTQERELRGVIGTALLGTMEEVGWRLRDALRALWAGERDLGTLTGQPQQEQGGGPACGAPNGSGAAGEQDRPPFVSPDSREYAALEAILYHTQRLEQEYGAAGAEGVAASLAAISNVGPARDSRWFDLHHQQQQQQQQQQQPPELQQQRQRRD